MRHIVTALFTVSALTAFGSSAMAGPGDAGHGHAAFATGVPGDPKKPARVVPVTLKETDDGKMLFFPDRVQVKRGEQVRFMLKNTGGVEHEFVLDTVANNAKHKAQMAKHPDMEHDDPNARRVAPGKGSEIVWRFTKAGEFEFACLIPGHYESGMKGTVVVK